MQIEYRKMTLGTYAEIYSLFQQRLVDWILSMLWFKLIGIFL